MEGQNSPVVTKELLKVSSILLAKREMSFMVFKLNFYFNDIRSKNTFEKFKSFKFKMNTNYLSKKCFFKKILVFLLIGIRRLIGCNHIRAFLLFTESINSECKENT